MSEKLSATIEVGLDGSKVQDGVAPIARTLENLGKTAKKAGRDAADGLGSVGEETSKTTAKVDAATKNLVSSTERAIARLKAELEGGSKSHAKFIEVLATQRGVNMDVLNPYLVKLKEIEKAQADAAKSTGNLGISAAQTAAAMRNVPAQFTDIITSLQGGQKPLTVFIQQGGQLKDMFGGAGNAAKAMGSYLMGMINPLTLAAGAATALGVAFYYGAEQAREMQRALIVSGNFAGATSAKLNDVAQNVGNLTGRFSEAREVVKQLAESGNFSLTSIQNLSGTILAASDVTGKSIEETVAQFEKLKKEPLKAIVDLNEKYNFLTVDIYKQIKALEERGEKEKASALALNIYADTVNSRNAQIKENLGYIESAWKGIKSETQAAIDTFLGFGRASDDAQKLAVARNQLMSMEQTAGNVLPDSLAAKEIADQEKLIQTIELRIKATDKSAKADGQAAEQRKQLTDQQKVFDDYIEKNSKSQKELAIKAANDSFAAAVKGLQKESDEYKKAASLHEEITKKITDQFKERTTKDESAYKTLSKTISEKLALSALEVAAEKPLSEAQKLRVKLTELEDAARGKLAKTKTAELSKSIELIRANELAGKTLANFDKDLAGIKAPGSLKEIAAEFEKQAASFTRINQGLDEYALGLEAQNELTQLELSLIGQSATERGILIEQYKIELGLQKEIRKIKAEIKDAGAAQILIDKATSNAEIEKSQAAIKVQQQEWTKFYGDIYNGLSDSLYRGFEAGKGFFQNFWDGIKNLFKTTVLKLAVQGVMTGVFGGVMGNVANAATMSNSVSNGGFSNLTSMYSAGKAMWEGFSAAGTVGGGITALGNTLGSSTLSAFGSGMSLTSSQSASAAAAYTNAGMSGTGTAISAGQSVGAAVPIVGWVLAGMAANNSLYDKGWGKKPEAGTVQASIATGMIGAGLTSTIQKLFGLSDKSASMWSGSAVANRLFGHQLPQLQQSELAGSFNADAGFSASIRDVYKEKGGVFRGDRWSEVKNAVDSAKAKDLSTVFEQMKTAAAGYAGTLGLSTDALKTFSKDFKVNLSITGDAAKDAEANSKIWSDLIVGVADDLSKTLMPSIADFAKENEKASDAFARIATNLSSVNSIFSDLNLTLFKTTDAGIKASLSFTDLFGGLDQLQAASQSYYQNFFTEEERNLKAKAALTAELSKVGLGDLSSLDAYRAAVEAADKAGNTDSLASLLKLSGAFAELYPVIDKTAEAAEKLAKDTEAAQIALAKLGSDRREELLSRRAGEEASAAIKKAADDAFKTLTESVTSGMQNMLRAGNISAALAAQMSITSLNPAQYNDASGFNAGAFNRTYAIASANAAKGLMSSVSVDALNVQDVSKVMQELIATVFDDAIVSNNKSNLIDQLKLPASDLIRTAMNGLLDAGVQSYMIENSVGRGSGVANVIGAQMDYMFASFEGMGLDLVEYTKLVDGLSWSLNNGKISQSDYAQALEAANKIIGENIDLLGNEAAQRERIAASQKTLNDAGLGSVSFYFNQISKSVEALNDAAVLANTPLAQVTAGIGRLTSMSDVFSQSAKAALSGGANLGNGQLINAQIVAEAAAKAAASITTADAAQAAKLLAGKDSFSSLGSTQLRDVSMLLDGVKAFDSVGFEASFMRMNDALNKGSITEAQYQDVFATSLNLYSGIVDQQDRELKAKTDFVDSLGTISGAMKDFYNSLLTDPNKSPLSQAARMQEIWGVYNDAKMALAAGDASRLNDFKTYGQQIADASNYSTRAEANYGYSRVLADSQLISRYSDRDPNAPQVAAIQNLEKSINERLDKQFAIMRSQLIELQNTRLEAARKNLPVEVSA